MKLKARNKPRSYSQTARAISAEETGRRIVEAFLARLMTQWFDEITLDRVAEDAEVTVQTIVRRFGGKDGLLAEAVKVLAVQITAQRAAPSGDIDRLVHNLIEDYEQTGDPVLRLLALEARQPVLKVFLDIGRREHRSWVAGAIGGCLDKLSGADRERAIDMLVIVTDVYTWKLLRRDMGRSAKAAESAIKKLIEGVIAEISNSSISC